MRPTNRGDGSTRAEQVTQGVRGMGRLGEGADEDHIDLGRQLLQQIFKAGIADEGNVMPFLLAPYADYLRHDAGKIRTHDASIQSSRRTPGNDVYDPDVEFSHVKTGSTVQCVLYRI